MADVNRGNRPLSPHLSIYRPQITSVMSAFNRITGIAMTLALVLVVWWFLAAATGPEAFATANGVITSLLGDLVMFVLLVCLAYHSCNGLRHLMWDMGVNMDKPQIVTTGIAALVAAAVFVLAVVIFA